MENLRAIALFAESYSHIAPGVRFFSTDYWYFTPGPDWNRRQSMNFSTHYPSGSEKHDKDSLNGNIEAHFKEAYSKRSYCSQACRMLRADDRNFNFYVDEAALKLRSAKPWTK